MAFHFYKDKQEYEAYQQGKERPRDRETCKEARIKHTQMGITKVLPNGRAKARLQQCIIRPYSMVSEKVDRHRSHGWMQQGKDLPKFLVEKGVGSVVCKKAKHPGAWEFTSITPLRIDKDVFGCF